MRMLQARIPGRGAQIAESLAEHAVARPAATGGHYTEISLVYFIEVNRC